VFSTAVVFLQNCYCRNYYISATILRMTKCFGYLRVSGKGQVCGDGFLRQMHSIEQYAKTHSLNVGRVFKDGGVSGSRSFADRPGFMDMLSSLHATGIKVVLIERLDRLARNLTVQESILAELKKHKFELVSVEEPDLLRDDPYRIMHRQFQGAIAQCEKSNLVLKLRVARQRMRERSGRCEGRKPYGARRGESRIIARMKELRVSGLSFEKIAQALAEQGVKPRTPGKRWHANTINQILKAERERTHAVEFARIA
jgi:DNA invertase Pin-like site-specific DNA recombinase